MLQIRRLTILALLVLFAGCDHPSKHSGSNVSTQPAQKVTTLTDADQQRLQGQRRGVEKYLVDDASRQKYQTAAGKLGTIAPSSRRACSSRTRLTSFSAWALSSATASLKLKMEWVMVEDQHGRDSAVRLPGTTIILFPLTMISKRVERGEQVDVFQLFNGVAAKVDQIKRAEAEA